VRVQREGFLVIDVWESEEAFAKFGEILGPVLGRVGLQPVPGIRKVYRVLGAGQVPAA
jgi:hypothetical protein